MKKIGLIILSLFILSLTGCMDKKNNTNPNPSAKTIVSSGDEVKVDYIGTFEDGKVFDTSFEDIAKQNGLYSTGRNYQPLSFTVGAHQMIKGFEDGVIGMKIGETKKITLAPKDAYGESSPQNITGVALDMFQKAGIEAKIGEIYNFGNGLQGKVTQISGDIVTLDFNPPMAGKTLIFDITLREIK